MSYPVVGNVVEDKGQCFLSLQALSQCQTSILVCRALLGPLQGSHGMSWSTPKLCSKQKYSVQNWFLRRHSKTLLGCTTTLHSTCRTLSMHCSRSGSSSKCRDPTADHMRTSCRICLSPAVQYSVMLIAWHNENTQWNLHARFTSTKLKGATNSDLAFC